AHKWRAGGLRVSDRHMHFVDGMNAELWIVELPPELMTNHGDIKGCFRFGSILNRKDDARSGEEECDDDEDGDHSPRHFHLYRAVDLRWFRIIVVPLLPETEDNEGEKSADNHK